MKERITIGKLTKKADKLSMDLPYKLIVEKDKDGYSIFKSYGMQGSDIVFFGTASECSIFLDGMLEMLRGLMG